MPKGVYPRNEMHREICRKARLGRSPWNKGYKHSLETKPCPPIFTGEKSSNWKDGRSLHSDYRRNKRKEWGIKNREKLNLIKKKRAWLKKKAGPLTIQTIQKIYEDNIKLFNTLTCVYCFKNIEFGEDTVDHVIALNKGGDHNEENLVIACRKCNAFKKDKLYEEVI